MILYDIVMSKEITQVAIGWTDGYRFVGIKRPLSPDEIKQLAVEGLVQDDHVEQIDLAPSCSLIHAGGSLLSGPIEATRKTQETGRNIARSLGRMRNEKVLFSPDPVRLIGAKSSPFNPDTDRGARIASI